MNKILSRSDAGRLGAISRMKKYGNPGTPEGRRRGGLRSVVVNLKLKNNFKSAKKHKLPKISEDLAELFGILFGDGHLSKYQVLVTTNSTTDMNHAIHVKNLIRDLFSLEPSLNNKKAENAVNVVVSSVNLVQWLNRKGMPIGNKLKGGLSVPNWIRGRKLEQAFIRGLFDTDGCVYVDHHLIKGKMYETLGWAITTYSGKLKNDIMRILKDLGFRPTSTSTQKSVYMRRRRDIDMYFQEIGTNNSKHESRYKTGRVPKWL